MPGSIVTRLESLAPFREKEFRQYIAFRFMYIMALRMVATVVSYKLLHLTGSSFAIGIVGLSEFIPVFSLALYAGHVIDRSDKKVLLLRGVIFYCLCVAALVVITTPMIEGQLKVPLFSYSLGKKTSVFTLLELLFYIAIFFTGFIRAFTGPTTHAIIALLVPRNVLHLAANISSSTWLIASIMGHATSGFFIAGFGVNATFYIIFGYVVIAAFIFSKVKKKPPVPGSVQKATWANMTEGLRYVFQNKVLLGAISLDLFAVLFGGAQAMVPEFSEKILKVGPIGYGWLNAAIDIGSAMTIITLTFFPMRRKQGYKLLFAVSGFGLCIIVFGFSTIYWVSFLAMLTAGVMDGISVLVRGTIFQLTTPDHIRGRVSAVNSMFVNSSNELGMFESGVASGLMGAAPSVVFGGCVTLLVVIITWIKAPKLRKFEY